MNEKEQKTPKKRGRKAININPDEVYQLASTGMGIMDICRNLNDGQGVSWDVFDKHRKKKKEISDALERGQSASVKFVNSKLMESIDEGSVQSIQFFLRNRRPDEWNKDQKQTVEHTLNLNDVLSGARQRIVNSPSNRIIDIDAEPLDTKDQSVAHKVTDQKKVIKG